MIKEIRARVLLSAVKQPNPWFGLKYNMNLYRGCQHQCIYCDSRSECYQIEDFEHDKRQFRVRRVYSTALDPDDAGDWFIVLLVQIGFLLCQI